MKEPSLNVGIMFEPVIRFDLKRTYKLKEGDKNYSGIITAQYKAGKIEVQGVLYDQLTFIPTEENCSFELYDVTIGINFHWERKENQRFKDGLTIISEDGKLTAINNISVENYLESVISSEMSATSNTELLKAHAIISRSWMLAQVDKNREISKNETEYQSITETADSYIRWYDREDHTNFDVCADDHCQRYQGMTKQSTGAVVDAVKETRGVVLTSNNKICDARFSKCCGGITEKFENAWEPVEHKYLQIFADVDSGKFTDISNEEAANSFIRQDIDAFCNTSDKTILSQVLNDYDQETADFYRWDVTYTQEQISDLIKRRRGEDFGDIIDLIPIERGEGGNILKLKIVGSKKTLTIGKELEIRKTLSESHLYSAKFVVDKEGDNEIPSSFTIKGAGWGHSIGLCQIGAAVMGAKGYKYDEILLHYFRGADLTKRY